MINLSDEQPPKTPFQKCAPKDTFKMYERKQTKFKKFHAQIAYMFIKRKSLTLQIGKKRIPESCDK